MTSHGSRDGNRKRPTRANWSWSLGFALVALMIVGSLLAWPKHEERFYQPKEGLMELLPEQVSNWVARDRPLGETELSQQAVAKTLRFDEAIYRIYERSGIYVGVYVAYWAPGKMDPWLIGLHTPDTCWVGNGATMDKRDDQLKLRCGPGKVVPAQFRLFLWSNGEPSEVIFWHLYGGMPSGFPVTGRDGPLADRLREGVQTLRNTRMGMVRKEQVFVRISTNGTISELTRSDLWPHFERLFVAVGIEKPN